MVFKWPSNDIAKTNFIYQKHGYQGTWPVSLMGLGEFLLRTYIWIFKQNIYGPRHGISNNVVCAISKGSDQPAHTRSLIKAFSGSLNILWTLTYCLNSICSF